MPSGEAGSPILDRCNGRIGQMGLIVITKRPIPLHLVAYGNSDAGADSGGRDRARFVLRMAI